MLTQLTILIWMFIVLIISIFIFRLGVFKFIDSQSQNRENHIDGLRFILSLSVVFHHFTLSYLYFNKQPWAISSLDIYPINQIIGGFGVALFFMVSGYIFSNTPPGNNNWIIFYLKRALRIFPVFIFSSLLCMLVAIYIQREEFNTGYLNKSLLYWFDGGITGIKPNLFGLDRSRYLNASVTWTLYWEWAFYFSLPLIYFLREKLDKLSLSISILFICVYLINYLDSKLVLYIAYFTSGFLARDIAQVHKLSKFKCNIFLTIFMMLFFILVQNTYSANTLPLLCIIFAFIVLGGDLFGLLSMRSVIRLGEISYSIYLLHGIFFYCMNKLVFTYFINVNTITYLLISFLSVIALFIFSSITYRYIEKPFINIGKRYLKYLK
jgi:peptidoglycan/LPS O-acetylase OafA/YrhL